MRRVQCIALFGCLIFCSTGLTRADAPPSAAPIQFARQIAPLLVSQCQNCHGPQKAKGKYRLDTLARLRTAGAGKAAPVVPGNPGQSELYRRITAHDEDERMPQKGDRLGDAQISMIHDWIAQGAAADGVDPDAPLASLADAEEPAAPDVYKHPVPATAVAFNPTGDRIAVAGYHEVTIWEPDSGRLITRVGHLPERIWSLAFTPDGLTLAVAGGSPGVSGAVVLCDARGDRPPRMLERIADMMLTARFSPDGKKLAAGGADNIVRLFDAASGKKERVIEQHADWVTDLAFSPDGEKLATASRDKSARVFDVKTGSMESAYLGHEEAVAAIAWSANGKDIFSVGRDRNLHAWKSADGKRINESQALDGDPIKIVATEASLFVCTAGGMVRSYLASSRRPGMSFDPAPDWIYSLSIDSEHRRLAGGCYNGDVIIWDLATGKLVRRFFAAPGLASTSGKQE